MFGLSLDTLINLSKVAVISALLVVYWYWATKRNKQRHAFFALLILLPFAWAAGEVWVSNQGTLPWFFGLETQFAERPDGGPLFLMTLIATAAVFILKLIFAVVNRIGGRIQKVRLGISSVTISAIILMVCLSAIVQAGAYTRNTWDTDLGSNAAHRIFLSAADVLGLGINITTAAAQDIDPDNPDNIKRAEQNRKEAEKNRRERQRQQEEKLSRELLEKDLNNN